MLNLGTNHRNLVLLSFWGYIILTIFIAIVPAKQMEDIKPLPGMEDMTAEERAGLKVYVSESCMACHTQQVRSIEMDNMWGSRPAIPSDYYYSKQRIDIWRQPPSLLGSERTGPDLTEIGKRQPSTDWHYLHLFNPRLVVKESVMPSYPWMFEEKDSTKITKNDVVINVPDKYIKNKKNKMVAKDNAKNLVAYLISLKQPELPGGRNVEFIPSVAKSTSSGGESGGDSGLDGEDLYMKNCAQCHQSDGTGLTGAFPALAGSPIVNDKDHTLMTMIILKGYDARPEYAVMTPFESLLNDEEIAAIMNHERTSWGNTGTKVTAEDVKAIRDSLK